MPTPKIVRQRRVIRAGMGLLLFALIGAALGRFYLIRTVPVTAEHLAAVSPPEQQILELVNRERLRAGLSGLTLSPRVAVIARGHSYDMALRHYMAHNSPEGITPGDRARGARINFEEFAENLYSEDGEPGGMAERAIAGWLNSPGHRANLLSPDFVATGIGIARSSDGVTYVTQDFVR